MQGFEREKDDSHGLPFDILTADKGFRIESTNASAMGLLLESIKDEGRFRLIMNLLGAEYTSSAGLREVVSAVRRRRAMDGDILIVASGRVKEIFDLAGIDSIFQIFSDVNVAKQEMLRMIAQDVDAKNWAEQVKGNNKE